MCDRSAHLQANLAGPEPKVRAAATKRVVSGKKTMWEADDSNCFRKGSNLCSRISHRLGINACRLHVDGGFTVTSFNEVPDYWDD